MKFTSLFTGLFLLTPLLYAADPAVENAVPTPKIVGVGSITDSAGDCKITGNAERLAIAIPAGDHSLDVERDCLTAPRVLQEVGGDFMAQVTITGPYPQNASSVADKHRPFQGAGLLLWVDSGTYIRLERAQVKIDAPEGVRRIAYPSWELRFEGKPLRWGGIDGTLTTPATTLRLSRTGNKVVAAISENGSDWRDLDPLTVKLPEKVKIGVCACHDTSSAFEAVFEHFTVKTLAKAGGESRE